MSSCHKSVTFWHCCTIRIPRVDNGKTVICFCHHPYHPIGTSMSSIPPTPSISPILSAPSLSLIHHILEIPRMPFTSGSWEVELTGVNTVVLLFSHIFAGFLNLSCSFSPLCYLPFLYTFFLRGFLPCCHSSFSTLFLLSACSPPVIPSKQW